MYFRDFVMIRYLSLRFLLFFPLEIYIYIVKCPKILDYNIIDTFDS